MPTRQLGWNCLAHYPANVLKCQQEKPAGEPEFTTAVTDLVADKLTITLAPMDEDRPKSPTTADGTVPKAVVSRLSLYLRELQRLVHEGQETTSSTQLGTVLGFTDAQVRKDLAYFGQFGYPGIGYRCEELIAVIRQILGTDRSWPVALIGLGNLGRALLRYRGFGHQGFCVAAAFDVDGSIVGQRIEEIPVYHLDQLAEIIEKLEIRLAIIAVPAPEAQGVATLLATAGIEGILNFAPVTITLPATVRHVEVDLAIELEQLSFAVVNRSEKT